MSVKSLAKPAKSTMATKPAKFSNPNSIALTMLLVILLVGCATPGMASANLFSTSGNAPAAAAPFAIAANPTYVLAPPDATPTPTPFQPLPPTPAIVPGSGEPTPALLLTETLVPGSPTPTPTLAITLPPEGFPQETALQELPSQLNVMLLGADRRPWDKSFRTDTLILVTLNFNLGTVNILSFPRDLYVTIPGFGMGRINTAWTYGGYNLFKETMQHNFGIKIDYFVLVEFSSFKKIVDGFGGLTINVQEPVSDYRAGYWVNIPKGEVKMDADTVLWYVRTRKTTNDIARNRRQQEVLQAIFEKLLSLNALRRAPEFYDLYRETVKTDIDMVDVLKWLPFAAKIAETRAIKQYYLTYNHVSDYITPEGAMVLVPNQKAVMQIIRKSQNLTP
jgi:LCP family protein required for cell wall assembly